MAWFESVAEAERRAKRVLPASVFKAIRAGTERGLTLEDNVAAFSELGFVENVLDVLRSGIDSALLGLGHASVHELSPSDLLIPDGFARRLGA
jgi:isopentenyl diphosphate isomerase/L-lactate dehydrogenase-like FMN-dependent dehydrogenase